MKLPAGLLKAGSPLRFDKLNYRVFERRLKTELLRHAPCATRIIK